MSEKYNDTYLVKKEDKLIYHDSEVKVYFSGGNTLILIIDGRFKWKYQSKIIDRNEIPSLIKILLNQESLIFNENYYTFA